MKSLVALFLSLAVLAPATASSAQSYERHGHEARPEARRGPEPRRGPDPRGGYGPREAPDWRGYPPPPPPRGGPDSLGADWGGQQDEVRAGVRQGRYIPLAQVIAQVRQRTPGHQLDAGLEDCGGRSCYRLRWSTPDGRRID